MDNNPSQNNHPSNNTHELNFTDSTNVLNNYSNIMPPTTSQSTNYLNDFHGRNDNVSAVNNNISSAHPPITSNRNNASTSQYLQNIDHTPFQNAFSPINSLNITINSPQTYFIFVPMSSSDMQNQLQQGHNNSPLQTQFQQ